MRTPTLLAVIAACSLLGACGTNADLIRIDVDGVERTYTLQIPDSAPDNAPLLLAFHGGGSSSRTAGRTMSRGTTLDALAQSEGFIVAYPNSFAGNWNDTRSGSGALDVDDLAFVDALLLDISERVSIDQGRIYSTGISNGAFFSQRLACQRSEVITAVYGVAATMPENLLDDCAPTRPVAVAVAMGTEDPLVPFDGGMVGRDRGLATSTSVLEDHWRNELNCTETDSEMLDDTDPSDGSSIVAVTHSGCSDNVELKVLTIDGGGHTWPGGQQYLPAGIVGTVNRDINMAEEVWAFVSQFSR